MNGTLLQRIVRGSGILVLILGLASAWAVTAPPPTGGKSQLARMSDARVNLKDSYQRATDARPGAITAGRNSSNSSAAAIANAIAARAVTQPGLEVQLSNLSGGPRSILDKSGALTAPAPGQSSEAIVRGYLSQNGDLFGLSAADLNDLVVLGDSAGGYSGLRMLRVEQQIDGRPIFQSESRFLIDREGRLVKGVGLLIPSARNLASAAIAAKFMSPETAVSKLLAAEGKTVDPAIYAVAPISGGRVEVAGSDGYTKGPITARQVLFPLAPGLLVPAWSLVAFTTGEQDWYAVVDAETGDLLWRKGIRNYVSTHEARFRVYVQPDGTTPADSPAPMSPTTALPGGGTQFPGIAPTIVNMSVAQDIAASPNGWIDDCPGGVCTATQTQTLGNNVLVCLDRAGTANVCDTDAASVLDGNGRPTGNPDANTRNRDFLGTTPRDFETNFLPPPQGGNPEAGQTATGAGTSGTAPIDQFRRGALTHLFYVSNWYHDKLHRLGFDEASGNFQQTNFSGMGLGGDRVLADAQDGSGTNNANFATPPDGVSGRMQMFRFTSPTIDRDGGLDTEIVFHELTHGTSNRLIGNGAGLNWDPAAGLGEGWSDFYALSLLNNTNADDPNGSYATGGYATYKLGGLLDNYVYGIRRFPYSTNLAVNPMTWADVDDVTNSLTGGIAPSPLNFNDNGGMEVHNSGEIWALTLWGVRARVIADPAGGHGDVPTGNQMMLQLVTDALKMTPNDPTFTQARDAILQADCATNSCDLEASIWAGFADRGLGYGAATPFNVMFGYTASHMGVKESFSVPFLDVANVATDVTIDDSASNNNGTIDPGEAVKLTVKLTNPWRAAAKAVTGATATLTTSTAGVTIYDNASTYGAIAPQGSATGDTFMFTVAPSVPCGSAIDFTLTTVSNLGTTVTTFQLRVGAASGTDPVVPYTGAPPGGLAIPDGTPRAVFHQMTIGDDKVIANLKFRINSLTHTFTGDLSAMLRSPDGLGVDLMSLIGGLTDGGPGDNIINMVMDDAVPAIAANDMVQATAVAAPFTKSWLPVFNAPWTTLAGFPAPDPVGNLSRYNGKSTKGTWSIAVSDQFNVDTGTLNAWSILVTPVRFVCTAFVPAVTMTATKTVLGTFAVGGTVTYTVILTNSGTANQADNPGNEFTDVLPAGLTLVSAAASSGTAVATVGTNTVTWNGALAPLGGSVTLTITATIKPGTEGTTISNQGTVAYDADGNGTNESTLLTDDPGVAGAANPTTFVVPVANVTGTMTVSGAPFAAGGTVTYTVVLTNSGSGVAPNTAGHEFVDTLPASLTLVAATATAGTAVATLGTNTVTWNGSLAASGGAVTITITAMVKPTTPIGTAVSSQGAYDFAAGLRASIALAKALTGLTDDPAVGGASDPTVFTTRGAAVTGTKVVSGSFVPGGAVTYTVVLSNTGNAPAADNPGNEFSDVLPASLTLVSASATGGTAVATVGTNTITWNGSIPAAGSVTITINATVKPTNPLGTIVSNQGTINFDADLNGTNESSILTDDPVLGGAADPTLFTVRGALVTGTKVVSGSFVRGGAVTYTIVLSNSGNAPAADNPGNEFTDVLPASLTLSSASASSGVATANLGTNTVTWNGSIPAAGSVTITINASISTSLSGSSSVTISNQGSFLFDADLNGSNESAGLTNNPNLPGNNNATTFTVNAATIPTLSEFGLLLLGLCMLGAMWRVSRRRDRIG